MIVLVEVVTVLDESFVEVVIEEVSAAMTLEANPDKRSGLGSKKTEDADSFVGSGNWEDMSFKDLSGRSAYSSGPYQS